MSRRWLLAMAILGVGAFGVPAAEGTMRATLGLEYDDNLFEYAQSRRAGWVSRLYLSSAGKLLERHWGNLQVNHQWGVKRFWRSEELSGATGDVVANQLEVEGVVRLGEHLSLAWGSDLKLKNVQRVSSEESYLRGGLELGLAGQWRRGWTGQLDYRRGGDDARDLRLADVSLHELGVGLSWSRSRRFSGRLGFRRHWVGLDRPALVVEEEGRLAESGKKQEDRGSEWTAGFQCYRGVLVQGNYAWVDNRSNSAGYRYRSHRLQVMLARHLMRRVDGQVFFTAQQRRYDQVLSGPLPGTGGEQDEYAQTLFSVKLARRLNERCDLSWQYLYTRNGSRLDDDFFRKNVYSLAIDMAI